MILKYELYNFSLDKNKYTNHPDMIYTELTDTRNGISTTNLIPGIQCYINYIELLLSFRDKWVSTGYLDLGMIPIIVGPSFMHEVLVNTILPVIQSNNLKIYALPATSFILYDTMKGTTDYWAFRSDVAKFLDCPEDRVTTRQVISKLMNMNLVGV